MAVITLKGRTAVVTGGSRGIGFAITKAFLAEGMNVAILCTNAVNGRKAVDTIEKTGTECRVYSCDVSSVSEIAATLMKANSDFGGIDVIVNCAGILDTSKIGDLSEQDWDRIIDVNLKGTYFMMQEALPYLKQSNYPRIINIASNAGRMGGFENGLAYSASKGGMIAITYGAARRLAPFGITVNCVAPGTIESDMSKNNYDEAARARLLQRFPLGRLGRPEEVPGAVCYLASEEASFTTGAVIDVNGGLFMG